MSTLALFHEAQNEYRVALKQRDAFHARPVEEQCGATCTQESEAAAAWVALCRTRMTLCEAQMEFETAQARHSKAVQELAAARAYKAQRDDERQAEEGRYLLDLNAGGN